MRKLLHRKIVEQGRECALCQVRFTNYNDIVPDHINPRVWGEPGGTTIPTTFRRCTGGANEEKTIRFK
jgi:hypothetical protein